MTISHRNLNIEKRRRLSVSIPEHAGPHVKLLFAEMRRQGWTYDQLEMRSGVTRPCLKAWRYKNSPNLQNLTAALQTLGWHLIPIPEERAIDADVLEELRPIANRLGLCLGDALQFAAEIALGMYTKKEPDPPKPEPKAEPKLQSAFQGSAPQRRAP